MQNIGEEIVGEYLKARRDCDFVSYNVHTPNVQGEIDVVGISTSRTRIYVCEVAIHLTSGLWYTGTQPSDNINRLLKKFEKDIAYAKAVFPQYEPHFMFWSPVVKSAGDRAKTNQMKDVLELQREVHRRHGYEIEMVINQVFQSCLRELRESAGLETRELKSPVMRYLQVEEYLKSHLAKLERRGAI